MPVIPRDPSAAPCETPPHPPTSEGGRPRSRRALFLLPLAAIAAIAGVAPAVAGCSNNSNDQETPPVALGMTSSVPAYYSDQNLTIYQVQTPVALPVKKPTAADMSNPAPAMTPYTHAPYLLASDESVEVHYTISNLDSQDYYVWLLIDPWNEFVRWNPGVTVVDDDVTEPNFGYDQEFVVPAMSRVQGTLTSDDFIEIATKLASVQNFLASPMAMQATTDAGASDSDMLDPTVIANHIFNPQNRSNVQDYNYTPWIPPVIAGVTGFDLGLRTWNSAGNIAVEITIDIVDLAGNRFVPADSKRPAARNAAHGAPPAVRAFPVANGRVATGAAPPTAPRLGSRAFGGERGIRTLGTLTGTPDFESGSFGHSDSSPPRKLLGSQHIVKRGMLKGASSMIPEPD